MSQGEVLNPNDAVATPQEQNLEQLIENYTGTPVENPEPPTTIVFECNKSLAVQDGLATTTNSWVNNFPSVKLRKGDMVSINSAFLSSRGSGDLLQFDETNNKTRLVFEYYCSNDNVNGKRIEYNIKGRVDNDNFDNFHYYNAPQGQQMPFLNCYPVNYRPMPLYRLMNTFNLTTSANGGLDLLPFTDTTTNPPSAVKEPFWGYKTASAQVEAIIEDDYVPGLFRDATLNISEPQFISWNGQNGYQKGSWTSENMSGLRIWYVSTRNSKLGACSSNASMRIYLGFAEGNADDDTATASLQFLRSIRPGQYIKFLNPGGLWNIDAFNGNSYLTTSPTKQYGTNCYYCNGYASNGNGFTNSDGVMVDKFKQIGNFDDWEWVNNPMGQIMRVSKIYFETGAGFPNGRAHIGGSGANWLSHIPYFEVQCAGSMSFAWGCPNAWEYPVPDPTGDTADVFKGMPYSGGGDIAQADITNSSLPPTNLTMSPYGAVNIRVLACENNSLYKNITNWNGKVGNNSTHASYYPAQRALDKTLYCASIPYYKDSSQQYMTGNYNNNGDGLLYENAENNLANNLNNSDNFKAGVSTGTQNFNPMNYNLQTLDISGQPEYPKTMVYSDFYFSENTYNGVELENTYAGGRLPVVYQTENEISTDTSNYITALRKHAYNFGSSGRRVWFQSNRSGDNGDVDGNAGFYSTSGRNLNVFQYRNPDTNDIDTISGNNGTTAGKLPYQQKNLNNISDKYCNTGKGSVWFYQALNIDNTTNQFVPSTQAGTPMPLAPGDSMFGANQTSGMFNYIITGTNLPDPANNIGGDPTPQQINLVADGNMYYGFNTDAGQSPDINTNIYITPNVATGAKDAQGNPINYIFYNGYNNTPCGIPDMRLVLSQFDSLCYAEFVNHNGESEVMYINIMWQPCYVITDANQTPATYFNTNPANPTNWGVVNNPHYTYEITGGLPGSPQNVLKYHFIPSFAIIQRDILGTGKKSFTGAWTDATTNPGNVMPTPADGGMFWRTDIYDNENFLTERNASKFRLFNSYSDMEWEVQFNDSRRDLYGATTNKFTEQNQYSTTAGNTGEDNIFIGSDFVLTEIPNMPFIDDNNIANTTANTLWIYAGHIQDGNPSNANTGALTWNKHYDYIDLELDKDATFFSPGDIANEITKQLHKPKDLYKSVGGGNKTGGTFPNTAGKYPANSLFRPIHAPSAPDNIENRTTGLLDGTYHAGDFCFFVDTTYNFMKDLYYCNQYLGGEQNNYLGDNGSKLVWDANGRGRFQVFPANNYTCVNTAPTTQFFSMAGMTLRDPQFGGAGRLIRRLYGDNNFQYSFGGGTIGERFQYYAHDEVILGQWIGASTPTLNYNDLNSRFEWTYLHQPFYSLYDTGQGSASGGGSLVANIWNVAINGMDNWDRFGGVNVVNWVAPIQGFGESSRRGTTAVDALTDIDPVGDAFMNKLGFDNTWRSNYSGSTTYADDNNTGYKPLGTTRSDYDVSQAVVYNQLQNGLTIFPLASAEVNNTTDDSGAKFGRIDYADTNSFAFQGSEIQSKAWWGGDTSNTYDKAKEALAKMNKVYNSIGYGWGSSAPFPPSIQNDSNNTQYTALNVNDIKLGLYQVQVESSALTANELPSKTDIGYFLIKTDLIDKHEFYGSANDGTNIGALGILSKNYENNDFYFSFQSPVEFYLKHDRVITQIKTEITTPTHTAPIGLDFASSVIYTITRMNSAPESAEPPMSLKQALAYDIMESQGLGDLMANPSGGYVAGAVANATGNPGGGSKSGNNALQIQQLRNQLVAQLTSGVNPMRTEQALTTLGGQEIARGRQLADPQVAIEELQQPDQAVVDELERFGYDLEQAVAEDIALKKRAERDHRTPSPVAVPPSYHRPESDPFDPFDPASFEDIGGASAPAETPRQREARLRATQRIRSVRETTPQREDIVAEYPPEAFLEQLLSRGVLGRREAGEVEAELYSGKLDPANPKTYSKSMLSKFGRFLSLGKQAGIELQGSEEFKTKVVEAIGQIELGRRREPQKPTFAMATGAERLTPEQAYTNEPMYNMAVRSLYPNDKMISLHEMISKTTEHTGEAEPTAVSDWINQATAEKLGGGKWKTMVAKKEREFNKPNENPFDIRTWRKGRLDQYRDFSKSHGALHRPGKESKKPGHERLNWEGYLQLHQESHRRSVQKQKKVQLDPKTAEYKKASDKPPNYTNFKEAHKSSNLSGAVSQPAQQPVVAQPAPAPKE